MEALAALLRPIEKQSIRAERAMETFWQDLRYGARLLTRNWSFTIVAVLALALGIGANTAIFSVINTVVLRPLPYPESDRIVTLWESNARKGLDRANVSPPNLNDWREQSHSFEKIAYWSANSGGTGDFNILKPDGIDKVYCTRVSSALFEVLSARPLLGRAFLAEEDVPASDKTVVIGYAFWQRRFGGNPNAIGQILTVDTYNRHDYTIVGVMPPGFQFPNQTEIWLPAGPEGARTNRAGHWLQTIAKLKPGATIEQARAELNAIQSRTEQQHPNEVIASQVVVTPLIERVLGPNLRQALWILWGIVAIVLLIACANVANLLLARAAARQQEIAVRLSLGAGRWRIVRQLLSESLLLAVFGGAGGLMLAYWTLNGLVIIGANNIPRIQDARLDTASLGFVLVISSLTSILFGFAPAWKFSKPDLNSALKENSRGAGEGLHRSRLRSALVISEIALSLILLISAALMTRSFVALVSIDRGFNPDHLITAQLDFSTSGFTTWVRPTSSRPQVTLKELMEQLKNRPGIQSVAAVNALPRSASSGRMQPIVIENHPFDPADPLTANFLAISPDYFRTMGISVLGGRAFNENDTFENQSVFIINETMAKLNFPNENPIGKHMASAGRNTGPAGPNPAAVTQWSEIVGVVADMKKLNIDAPTSPDVYVSYWQYPMQTPLLMVRTTNDASGTAAEINSTIKTLNRNVPIPKIQTMNEILADTVAQPRFYTILSAMFGITALILATIGIYGVISYSVSQRTREMGIRLALGAQSRDVYKIVVGHGMLITIIGIAVGLAASFALTRLMSSLLFGVSASDPVTFVLISLLLAIVSFVASYLPARRATRVNPMIALRYE